MWEAEILPVTVKIIEVFSSFNVDFWRFLAKSAEISFKGYTSFLLMFVKTDKLSINITIVYCTIAFWRKFKDICRVICACTNFLKQEVMTSTLWDLEVTGLICGSQTMHAPCSAKNVTLFLNMMLFAMLSFMFTGFLCLFLNRFMFNSVKQCKSWNWIYFILSFWYLFNDSKFANNYEQKHCGPISDCP